MRKRDDRPQRRQGRPRDRQQEQINMKKEQINMKKEQINMKNYDLIVVGGGLSGVAAAISAAREGLCVLLIEKNSNLGGAASNCLINPFMKYLLKKQDDKGNTYYEQLNCGIFAVIVEKLRNLNALNESDLYAVAFNNEYMKKVLEDLCEEFSVDLLYNTVLTGAEVSDGTVNSVTVYNKNGFFRLEADYFIDCTGDGDLCVAAGAKYRLGRDEDNLCQPMTLCFWISNVDMELFKKDRPKINEKYKEWQSEGKIKNPRENVLIFRHIAPGILHFNTTRIINLNPVDAWDLTRAQREARKQVFEMYDFLKENFESFRHSVLLLSAPEIGIRESRLIDGDYVYCLEDILSYRKFDDSVACGCYEVDIHNPSGTGTHLIYLKSDDYYTIPLRSLCPRGIKNLLVAGRCISSTHEAQSAYRIMPIVCNIGEGAGIAAALAYKRKTEPRFVDIGELHELMNKYGARY